VFENSVMRKIFVPKRDEATGYLWRLYTEELYDMYLSPDITGASEIGTCCTDRNIERVIKRHHIHPEHNDGYDSFKSYNKPAFLMFCIWFSAFLIFHECESDYKVTR
jgi:hypothetical protein